MHQIIAAQLEHSDPPHKLCLAQRDFSNDPFSNSSGNGETFRSVSHLCSAHILVVSRSYLESMWPKVRFRIKTCKMHFVNYTYRVTHLISKNLLLTYYDSFGSSWASTAATYCTGKMAEHPKSKETGGFLATRWVTSYY